MKLPSALVAAAICCLASHGTYAADVELSGNAFYRERIALPQDAALLVEFIDLAKPKALLGCAATVAPAGKIPIAFDLVVNASKLSKAEVYAGSTSPA
jgi:putative lipoprotein